MKVTATGVASTYLARVFSCATAGSGARAQRCAPAATTTRPIATDTSIVARLAHHHRRARTVSHSPATIAVPPAAVQGIPAAAYSGVSVVDIFHQADRPNTPNQTV